MYSRRSVTRAVRSHLTRSVSDYTSLLWPKCLQRHEPTTPLQLVTLGAEAQKRWRCRQYRRAIGKTCNCFTEGGSYGKACGHNNASQQFWHYIWVGGSSILMYTSSREDLTLKWQNRWRTQRLRHYCHIYPRRVLSFRCINHILHLSCVLDVLARGTKNVCYMHAKFNCESGSPGNSLVIISAVTVVC